MGPAVLVEVGVEPEAVEHTVLAPVVRAQGGRATRLALVGPVGTNGLTDLIDSTGTSAGTRADPPATRGRPTRADGSTIDRIVSGPELGRTAIEPDGIDRIDRTEPTAPSPGGLAGRPIGLPGRELDPRAMEPVPGPLESQATTVDPVVDALAVVSGPVVDVPVVDVQAKASKDAATDRDHGRPRIGRDGAVRGPRIEDEAKMARPVGRAMGDRVGETQPGSAAVASSGGPGPDRIGVTPQLAQLVTVDSRAVGPGLETANPTDGRSGASSPVGIVRPGRIRIGIPVEIGGSSRAATLGRLAATKMVRAVDGLTGPSQVGVGRANNAPIERRGRLGAGTSPDRPIDRAGKTGIAPAVRAATAGPPRAGAGRRARTASGARTSEMALAPVGPARTVRPVGAGMDLVKVRGRPGGPGIATGRLIDVPARATDSRVDVERLVGRGTGAAGPVGPRSGATAGPSGLIDGRQTGVSTGPIGRARGRPAADAGRSRAVGTGRVVAAVRRTGVDLSIGLIGRGRRRPGAVARRPARMSRRTGPGPVRGGRLETVPRPVGDATVRSGPRPSPTMTVQTGP
jgi:hypothetical protein